jgi:hypothetical protein
MIADVQFWQNFWPNWWANFAANLVVGVILTGLIGWIIQKRQKVDVAMQTTIRSTEDDRTVAYFGIVNCGNVVMRRDDVHFHVFVRESRVPERALARLSTERRVRIAGNKYVELKNTLHRTIFPSRETTVAEIPLVSADFEVHDFLYYLSTAQGVFPKTCKIDKAKRQISGFGCMVWFHVFPKDGDAKVITPQQKISEMIAAGTAKPPQALKED